MAKGASTEKELGVLHSMLTRVFSKVLADYERKLDKAEEAASSDSLEDEMLAGLLEAGAQINPALLSAVSKFLKDNEIGIDSEEIEALSEQERQIASRRKARQRAGMDLSKVPVLQ